MTMTNKIFEGKAAIVTGGTRGIGKAIVLELARRGANVAFNFSKSARAKFSFSRSEIFLTLFWFSSALYDAKINFILYLNTAPYISPDIEA